MWILSIRFFIILIKYLGGNSLKIIKALSVIIFIVALIGLVLFATNQYMLGGNSSEWFLNVSSISTAVGVIINILLFVVTFFYLLATRKMVEEMRKQRESVEMPVVSIKIVPDSKLFGLLNLNVKNTGGSPAYDVSITFDPDIKYKKSSLNELTMFQNMPVLDKNENIEFLFGSAHEYFNSNNPKSTTAKIKYYLKPKDVKPNHSKERNDPIERSIRINFEERKGQLYANKSSMDDLVKEIEEIKQGLLMILAGEKKNDI